MPITLTGVWASSTEFGPSTVMFDGTNSTTDDVYINIGLTVDNDVAPQRDYHDPSIRGNADVPMQVILNSMFPDPKTGNATPNIGVHFDLRVPWSGDLMVSVYLGKACDMRIGTFSWLFKFQAFAELTKGYGIYWGPNVLSASPEQFFSIYWRPK